MKFSEIEEKSWDELRPYLDTAVLPVTGLGGGETPWETTMALEHLRDALDLIEIPFKGRIVTYPAMHFVNDAHQAPEGMLLEQVSAGLKNAGFRFVVVVTAKSEQELGDKQLVGEHVDLLLRCPPDELRLSGNEAKRKATELMANLWNGSPSS
ncbi:23S rRNA (pseudouridine1915-N3)-methyltransferase [Paenibacillus sp. PvR052]|uniref:DUF2487 family protein n=1 Tax=Paenibacillus sp. PvP091 TaxID=2806590 RepID=UPI001AE892DC|nr:MULTISPECIES: DUF2487 family protein [unclassified Paenibacillus]MBP1155283.1 hypothetical protein [Paenibacillus sp. PvP091]MBP1169333.1 hypothetical protein [Paenibacillus sp. PvR098]MBP2440361.1 hypothetical protein [Paenibacillus sp. PvP052]